MLETKTLKDLNLSTRAMNVFIANNYAEDFPVAKLMIWEPSSFLRLRGMGRKTYKEIMTKLTVAWDLYPLALELREAEKALDCHIRETERIFKSCIQISGSLGRERRRLYKQIGLYF